MTLLVAAGQGLATLPAGEGFFKTVALVTDDDDTARISADLVVRVPFDPYTLGEELQALDD